MCSPDPYRLLHLTGATYYNFYSTGEEVLDVHTGALKIYEDAKAMALDGGRFAWVLSEKEKGRMWINFGGSDYGGWGFYEKYVIESPGSTTTYMNKTMPLSIANQLTPAQLKVQPFFKLGRASSLVEPNGSSWADTNHAILISESVPATTVAAGGEGGVALKDSGRIKSTQVLDMQAVFKNGWPNERTNKGDVRWKHSDLRNVSYIYIYKIFSKMADPTGVLQ